MLAFCGFQPSAFQNNAFQNCGGGKKVVGWFDEWDVGRRFRHDPEELERRLKEQRGFAFKDFQEAQEAVLARAKTAKTQKHRTALVEAVAETMTFRPFERAPELDHIITALHAAANASRATASIKHAALIQLFARQILNYDEEEDEIALLLWMN